jgi:bacterioferritin-associated ferredoxin
MSDETARPTAPRYVCRCEEIEAAAIRQAIADGAQSVDDVKRRTRAGMGLCQGIFCVRPIAELLERHGGLTIEQLAPMTARPPVRPIPLALLASMEE